MSNYIESLNWRYATKKFDADKKLSAEEIENLVDAIRLSASSYGLQPYRVLVISDPEVRKTLRPACWDQSQITDASHLLVFTHQTDFGPELVDSYIDTVSETRGVAKEKLSGYADFMKSKLVELPASAKANWTARQAYLAVGNLLSAAAAARIDACPMEGFEAEKVNEILGLTSKGLSAAVLVAVGHRSQEDATQHNEKVRRPHEEIFTHI
ncbi:NAD(P)H-dependent oxidoreductase [Robiginitalea sp. SC105]|nr:NAD(P)H-dependent oxidoreductase [Robiginitalea sp. SC105]